MANFANSKRKSNPTSTSEKRIKGANPTYRSHVQREANGGADTARKAAKKAERKTGQPPNPSAQTVAKPRPAGFGDGHYVPNK